MKETVNLIASGRLKGVVEFPCELLELKKEDVAALFPRPFGATVVFCRCSMEQNMLRALQFRREEIATWEAKRKAEGAASASPHPNPQAPLRHLFMSAPSPRQALQTQLSLSEPFFHAVSHLVVDISQKSAEDCADGIIELLGRFIQFVGVSVGRSERLISPSPSPLPLPLPLPSSAQPSTSSSSLGQNPQPQMKNGYYGKAI